MDEQRPSAVRMHGVVPAATISARHTRAVAAYILAVREQIMASCGTDRPYAAFARLIARRSPDCPDPRKVAKRVAEQLNSTRGPSWKVTEQVIRFAVAPSQRERTRMRLAMLYQRARGEAPPGMDNLDTLNDLDNPHGEVERFGTSELDELRRAHAENVWKLHLLRDITHRARANYATTRARLTETTMLVDTMRSRLDEAQRDLAETRARLLFWQGTARWLEQGMRTPHTTATRFPSRGPDVGDKGDVETLAPAPATASIASAGWPGRATAPLPRRITTAPTRTQGQASERWPATPEHPTTRGGEWRTLTPGSPPPPAGCPRPAENCRDDQEQADRSGASALVWRTGDRRAARARAWRRKRQQVAGRRITVAGGSRLVGRQPLSRGVPIDRYRSEPRYPAAPARADAGVKDDGVRTWPGGVAVLGYPLFDAPVPAMTFRSRIRAAVCGVLDTAVCLATIALMITVPLATLWVLEAGIDGRVSSYLASGALLAGGLTEGAVYCGYRVCRNLLADWSGQPRSFWWIHS